MKKRGFPRPRAEESPVSALPDVLRVDPPEAKDFCTRFVRNSHSATLSRFLPLRVHPVPPIVPRTWCLHIVHIHLDLLLDVRNPE
jgi:hypothetical protein